MSPFREPPRVELGPLDVGLEAAARRAAARLPRGGRIVAARPGPGPAATFTGVLGSAGLLLVIATGAVACATGFRPLTLTGVMASLAVVVLGGLSLAVVFRTLDRTPFAPARPGEHVGKKAQGVLQRFGRLEVRLRPRPHAPPPSPRALRRALSAASDPEIAPWIPADVRGRAELLLAREIAAARGTVQTPAAREVRALLTAAAGHLDDPSPACADLAALARDVQRRGW